MEGDTGIGEKHRIRHRRVVELRAQVHLFLPKNVQGARRGTLASLATDHLDGTNCDRATGLQPGHTIGQVDARSRGGWALIVCRQHRTGSRFGKGVNFCLRHHMRLQRLGLAATYAVLAAKVPEIMWSPASNEF